jgi:putative hydrolase of the HAD superfamily
MKKIVFDLAQVLLSWSPPAMLMRTVPHLAGGPAQAAQLERALFENWLGDWAEFDRGALDVPQIVERIVRRTGLAAADVQAVVAQIPHELQPMPDSVALLHRLADAGHPVFYLSNMPAPYALQLERLPFFNRFAGGIFSGRVGHNKPEAAIYSLAHQRFGLQAGDAVFLDDTAINIPPARAQGWHALQFTHAAAAEQAMRSAGWVSL